MALGHVAIYVSSVRRLRVRRGSPSMQFVPTRRQHTRIGIYACWYAVLCCLYVYHLPCSIEYVAPLGSTSLIFNFLFAKFLVNSPVTYNDIYVSSGVSREDTI